MIRTIDELYEAVVKGKVDPNNLASCYADLVRAVYEINVRLKALDGTQPKAEWGSSLGSDI
jgi:hypothetical protein